MIVSFLKKLHCTPRLDYIWNILDTNIMSLAFIDPTLIVLDF